MFHDIPKEIALRMEYLEAIDAKDREDGTPRMGRLRQIPPVIGKFISLLATTAPKGEFLEIGTSAGYSSLWLALACKQIGAKLVTFEVLQDKIKLAKETFESANVHDVIQLIEGDARDHIEDYKHQFVPI